MRAGAPPPSGPGVWSGGGADVVVGGGVGGVGALRREGSCGRGAGAAPGTGTAPVQVLAQIARHRSRLG